MCASSSSDFEAAKLVAGKTRGVVYQQCHRRETFGQAEYGGRAAGVGQFRDGLDRAIGDSVAGVMDVRNDRPSVGHELGGDDRTDPLAGSCHNRRTVLHERSVVIARSPKQ